MIGKTISHYKILEKLGQGGMGVVYKAKDTKLDRFVALKFLPPHIGADDEEKKRFIHEAKAASSLDHPNICVIHEIDETQDGQMFISMGFYEGETLKDKIASGPLKLDEAIDIAIQTVQGLTKAHDKEIVHRDIKPANIMITKDGVVKILDFGLAKLSGQTKLTKSSSTLGTVGYMSPEQAQGSEVDYRTDIWSLGVVLYEMVTGQLPFKGDYEQAMMYSIVNEELEPVTGLRTGIPMELDRIVIKVLAKYPDERYQHVDEMLVDLKNLKSLKTKQIKPVSIKSKSRLHRFITSRILWTLIIVLFGLFSGVLLFYPSNGISFSERDWILITDFENQTDDDVFDKSLNTALTVSIEQSSYVNVFSQQRMIETLKRMKRDEVTKIYETVGQEIAIREGITIILVPSISSVGHEYVLTGVLRESKTGKTLKSEIVRAHGKEKLLDALDNLSKKIREDLGESVNDIKKQGKPLAKVTTSSLAALKQYSLGREKHYMPKDWEEVKVYYENAIEFDTTFASAYASLGTVYSNMGFGGDIAENQREVRKCYLKAIQYIDNLTDREKYRIMATYFDKVELNPEKAIQNYRTLLELYPDYRGGHNNLGIIYQGLGRHDEAITEYKEEIKIDPYYMLPYNNLVLLHTDLQQFDEAIDVSLDRMKIDSSYSIGYTFLGRAYCAKGLYDEAIAVHKKAVKLDPYNYWVHSHFGVTYKEKGLIDKAIEEFNKAYTINSKNTFAISQLVYTYARNDESKEALNMLENLLRISSKADNFYHGACIHSLLKQKEKALEYLNIAINKGWRNYEQTKTDTDLDFIRDDPLFTDLLKRIENASDILK